MEFACSNKNKCSIKSILSRAYSYPSKSCRRIDIIKGCVHGAVNNSRCVLNLRFVASNVCMLQNRKERGVLLPYLFFKYFFYYC